MTGLFSKRCDTVFGSQKKSSLFKTCKIENGLGNMFAWVCSEFFTGVSCKP